MDKLSRKRLLYSVCLTSLDLFLIISLLLIPLAWLFDPLKINWWHLRLSVGWGWKPVLIPVLILLARIGLDKWVRFISIKPARGLWERSGFKKLCFSLVSMYVFFALLEAVLGWTRFNVELPPIIFQGQNHQGGLKIPKTLPDAELMFKLAPGTYFQGRLINSMGFREREVDPQKAPGVIRVVCMGDSITGQGRPGYSQYLHDLLSTNPPTAKSWEAFNIGVHGYTSLQGLRLFQKLGRSLSPDVVTLYFGWNGHWLSEEADRQKMGLEMRPFAGRVFNLLKKKRFFRFVVWTMNPVRHLARRDVGSARVPRVPPEEYRSTLTAFVREIRAAGAVPVLITAPRRSVTKHVVYKRYVLSIEQGNRDHDEYVEITRGVARETDTELLDLAVIFSGKECDSYFDQDGIHFDSYAREGSMKSDPTNQPGLRRIAVEIDRKLREIIQTPAWKSRVEKM